MGSNSMLRRLLALMKKGAAGGTLTQKGYGHVYDTGGTSNLAMSYGSVDGGSAPAAGDLVAWIVLASDTVGSPIVDLTSSGWAQQSISISNSIFVTMLAKVVVSGDVSSPPTVVSGPDFGSIAFWVAYSVTGTISSLSVPTLNAQYGGNSAPSNQTCDSSALSAPDVAITLGVGGGNDNSPTLTISGATADVDFVGANDQWFVGTEEDRFIANATIGGANITFSKSDDGGANHMASGYIAVAF